MESPRSGVRRARAASWALAGLGVAAVAGTSTLAYADTTAPAAPAAQVVVDPVPADSGPPPPLDLPVPATTTADTPVVPVPPPDPTVEQAPATTRWTPAPVYTPRQTYQPTPVQTSDSAPAPEQITQTREPSTPPDDPTAHPHSDTQAVAELLTARDGVTRLMTLDAPDLAHSRWQRWSTDMHIVVTEPASLRRARFEVDAELDAVERAASRFRPDSEVMALATSDGRPTRISETLAVLLEAALTAARETDGDVDPTVGAAVVALEGDGRAALSTITPACWSMVALDGRVVTVPPGVLLDLGATAKAVAADRCADRVHEVTGSGVLINLGGDIATAGPAPDGGWQVLVHDVDGDPDSAVALPSGTALATSSTLRRTWRRNDAVLHHILDPRTGRSADPVWRTVSVAAQTCWAANTVSTAAIVRGWAALPWIAALGMSARLVDSECVEHTIGTWPRTAAEARR